MPTTQSEPTPATETVPPRPPDWAKLNPLKNLLPRVALAMHTNDAAALEAWTKGEEPVLEPNPNGPGYRLAGSMFTLVRTLTSEQPDPLAPNTDHWAKCAHEILEHIRPRRTTAAPEPAAKPAPQSARAAHFPAPDVFATPSPQSQTPGGPPEWIADLEAVIVLSHTRGATLARALLGPLIDRLCQASPPCLVWQRREGAADAQPRIPRDVLDELSLWAGVSGSAALLVAFARAEQIRNQPQTPLPDPRRTASRPRPTPTNAAPSRPNPVATPSPAAPTPQTTPRAPAPKTPPSGPVAPAAPAGAAPPPPAAPPKIDPVTADTATRRLNLISVANEFFQNADVVYSQPSAALLEHSPRIHAVLFGGANFTGEPFFRETAVPADPADPDALRWKIELTPSARKQIEECHRLHPSHTPTLALRVQFGGHFLPPAAPAAPAPTSTPAPPAAKAPGALPERRTVIQREVPATEATPPEPPELPFSL